MKFCFIVVIIHLLIVKGLQNKAKPKFYLIETADTHAELNVTRLDHGKAKTGKRDNCEFGQREGNVVDGHQEKEMVESIYVNLNSRRNIGFKKEMQQDMQQGKSSIIPLNSTNCTSRFTEENVIFHGSLIYSENVKSWVDCLTKCQSRVQCMFWTFRYQDKRCCLKTGGEEITTSYSSGVISGISHKVSGRTSGGRRQSQDDRCVTDGGKHTGAKCIFPFIYGGIKYNRCTSVYHTQPWCATIVDDSGYFVNWGNCVSTCVLQCKEATVDISPIKHFYAEDGLEASRIALASCYGPESVTGDTYWRHVRNIFRPDVFLWLGDNAYKDGTDMNEKRIAYNAARDQASYISHGPVMEGGKIPVMATWDDHDYASDNMGKEYSCKKESQNEFVNHFNIPSTDPRHSEYPGGQQSGVYNARMFLQPGTRDNGIHTIMLDARVGRDPTNSVFGTCMGAQSRFLSDAQWTWLDQELDKSSIVKIIGSGIQVLMPTYLKVEPSMYCAHDSHSPGSTSTFMDAIEAVGEDINWEGTIYETWGQIPQERAKLLGKVQKSINDGKTKVAIFISGDQHWSELMVKRMPASTTYGSSQVLHEITSSGVYQDWNYDIQNSNRLSAENELSKLAFSNSTKTCSNSKFHVCNAQATYGTVEVDFENKNVKMSIISPEEQEVTSHQVSF